MIKAIIFDCFGVLVDDWLSSVAKKYPVDIQKQLWDVVKASNIGFIDYKQGATQMAAALGMSVNELYDIRANNEVKDAELMAYIIELKKQDYKIAVLSNVSAGGISRRFSNDEIGKLFDVVVESGTVGFAKPDVNSYLYTSEQLGITPSECVMVDDKEDFCAGAEAAGMSSIVYKDFGSFKPKLSSLLADSNS